jgi:oligosaccharide repeat unit polymerase
MTSAAPTFPSLGHASLRIPAAAIEVLAYLTLVATAALAFVAGSLTVNAAVVITVILLSSLIILSWTNLGRGRHPCFLFLCSLTLFQGGRLIAYCLGAEPDPMRVALMGTHMFNFSRDIQSLTLLSIVISALCVYAPCRWNYRAIPIPDWRPVRSFLPYLYLVFLTTLPVQAFKNYRYYEYAQQHGGYLYLYLDHAGLASSVPFLVRVVSLVTLPVFAALFVFETRKKYLYLVTVLYIATASFILLLGQRSAVFALAVALWYVARVKSNQEPRIFRLAAFVLLLVLAATAIQANRESPDEALSASNLIEAPADVLVLQGASLGVTEVALRYRALFAPFGIEYLSHEVRDAFVASDASSYYRGKLFPFDVSALLNPGTFNLGLGTGGSYVGEAYVLGGLAGVVAISLLIGLGLGLLYRMSGRSELLFLVAMLLSDVLWMPRGVLLDWFSAFLRNLISIVLLAAGWWAYRVVVSIRHSPASDRFLSTQAGNV